MTTRPMATYRLQLGPRLGFTGLRELLPYLRSLGVTTAYLSPLLQSVRGGHGYDVTDPRRPNEQLGTEGELHDLLDAAAAEGLDLLLDIVPNHMAASTENPFWRDVLEKGRASRFARMFDIDWDAPEAGGRLVLPVLTSTLEELASAGEAGLESAEEGELLLACGALRLPLSPWSYPAVLRADDGAVVPADLAPALRAARGLPRPEEGTAAERELLESATATLKLRLAEAVGGSPAAAGYLRERLASFSTAGAGVEGVRRLTRLAAAQPYLLLPWRPGSRIVNYRRFFDIADLVAVRQEEPGVFELTHGYLLELLRHPAVAGFRVDHVDGLDDPCGYLERLRQEADQALIVVEKILAEGERLPPGWPVDGTTGYEVSAAIDRLLVDGRGWSQLRRASEDFTRRELPPFRSLAEAAKREVLASLFPREVGALARDLPVRRSGEDGEAQAADRGDAADHGEAQADREAAVADLTAALPVYRTYFGDPAEVASSASWLERAALALRAPAAGAGPGRERAREEVTRTIVTSPARGDGLAWTRRWQRLTGAAAAKGVEDTALYRYPVLLSRNEVGEEPDADSLDVEAFFSLMLGRGEPGRGGLSATSTHDAKRDEDARARLHVLSERARDWSGVRQRWHALNDPLRRVAGPGPAPDAEEEELIYQSLVALWPLDRRDEGAAVDRLCAYVLKALREAKRHTSWIDPSSEYEAAVEGFVRAALAPERPFRNELRGWVRGVAASGAVNALALVLLRTVVPGIPDTYQGTELWVQPKLVDPDNRGAVDFALRRRLLHDLDRREAEHRAGLLEELVAEWPDGRLKLYVLSRALRWRRAEGALFSQGEFVHLEVAGRRSGRPRRARPTV